MLKYVQQRILCYCCGKYDRRVKSAPKKTLCDHCGEPAELVEWCTGRGFVEVPWKGRLFRLTENMNIGEQGYGRTPKGKRNKLDGTYDELSLELARPVSGDEVNELLETLQ